MTRCLSRAAALAALLAAGLLRADERRFIPLFDADLRGGFSKLNRGPFSWAGIGTVLGLPAYKVTATGMLLPIYAFDGSVNDKTIEVAETGGVFFVQHQVHSGSLGWKQQLGEGLDAKLSFDGAYALNRETPSEKVGKGLYDYYDLGGRAVVTYKAAYDGRPMPLSGSLKVYQRYYPNFEGLAQKNRAELAATDPAAAALVGDLEKHPKDYLGVEVGASQAMTASFGRLSAGYTGALKKYSDSYLKSDQGLLLTTAKRLDFLHRLILGWGLGAPSGWSYGVQLDARFNQSNSTNYEVQQKFHPFIPHFNQFGSLQAAPWTEWAFGEGPLHPRLRLTEITMVRAYTDRFRQNDKGEYINGKQREFEYLLDVRVWYPFTKWLGATAGVTGGLDRSNNHFEQLARYNYETLVVTAGLTVSF